MQLCCRQSRGRAESTRTGLHFLQSIFAAGSGHVLTWHSWNVAAGRREHENPLHTPCSFSGFERLKEEPWCCSVSGLLITRAGERWMRDMVECHFLRSLPHVSLIHYCKNHKRARYDFSSQGCSKGKQNFSSSSGCSFAWLGGEHYRISATVWKLPK